jgi:hypothetical protein
MVGSLGFHYFLVAVHLPVQMFLRDLADGIKDFVFTADL